MLQEMLMAHFLRNPNSDVPKWQAGQVWEAGVVIPPRAPPTPASSPPPPRLLPSPHSTKCHDERTKSRLALQTKYETIAIFLPNNFKSRDTALCTGESPDVLITLDLMLP